MTLRNFNILSAVVLILLVLLTGYTAYHVAVSGSIFIIPLCVECLAIGVFVDTWLRYNRILK